MNKNLRLFMLALLCAVLSTVWGAEAVIATSAGSTHEAGIETPIPLPDDMQDERVLAVDPYNTTVPAEGGSGTLNIITQNIDMSALSYARVVVGP